MAAMNLPEEARQLAAEGVAAVAAASTSDDLRSVDQRFLAKTARLITAR